jgi:cytochrome c2
LLLLAACKKPEPPPPPFGDAARGKSVLAKYGCTSCHAIPGVQGPRGMVGPPLDHIASRQIIAGKYPNSPELMAKWMQDPQAMDPGNAMPNLGVTPQDARDITAFLFTLK